MNVGIDVGGTFTDIVAVTEDGQVSVKKVQSVRHGFGDDLWPSVAGLSSGRAIERLIHGTTVATNALIERRGGKVVLLTTAGFEDIPWLRRQDRAGLYDLIRDYTPPPIERSHVIGVNERITRSGVLTPLTGAELERVLERIAALEPESVAICLLFGFLHPQHEELLAAGVRERFPSVPVAPGHEVLPRFREYERMTTVLAEAFLRPVVGPYLTDFARCAPVEGEERIRVMSSSGGTLSIVQAVRRTAELALSGPAGGVEGARIIGERVGLTDLLTLDMGGTSADASLIVNGRPAMAQSGEVGDMPLALPRVLIETVGAGGGSIGWVDPGGALRVGPASAGAEPGPACYGKGGTDATVTDACVVLGWLDPAQPLASTVSLDPDRAGEAIEMLAGKAGLSRKRCAEGIIAVATATMVRALRRVSVERGIDPRSLALTVFGGAGPLFGCRLADELGIRRVVVPPQAGVLSALGLVAAAERVERSAPCHRLARDLDWKEIQHLTATLDRDLTTEISGAVHTAFADCRYPGQGYELTVPLGSNSAELAANFHRLHRERYRHADESRDVELVNLTVVAERRAPPLELKGSGDGAGERIRGPATLHAPDTTIRIEAGWTATRHECGALIVERNP